MFTGLIEEIGTVLAIQPLESGRRLQITAAKILDDLKVDDSVAVNGVCLTAEQIGEKTFEVAAVAETLSRSIIGELRKGNPVNLERALRLNDRLGGHLVQGHVDGIGKILAINKHGVGYDLDIEIPTALTKYVIEKGSLTVNGVSLTVAEIHGLRIRMAVIPHTWMHTTFQSCRAGDRVNIEVDLIGKYVEKLIAPQSHLSEEKLREMGY